MIHQEQEYKRDKKRQDDTTRKKLEHEGREEKGKGNVTDVQSVHLRNFIDYASSLLPCSGIDQFFFPLRPPL